MKYFKVNLDKERRMTKFMKKNMKNGFTLVELLAVIVILAIVLVIAVPKVMSVIEDAKKATLESTAKMIASGVEKAKEHIHYYITVDNFDTLSRGGRVPKGVGAFADALGIKPVITVIDGKLALLQKGAKQRGMKRCMNKILNLIGEEVKVNERTLITFAHAYDKEKSLTFASLFKERFGRDADLYSQIGTSIGVHGGPTAFAVFIDDFDA